MKLTKTKLNQLIREALAENWVDQLMKLGDADEDGYGSPAGLVLDADEYELIQAALGFGMTLAKKGFDTPAGRGDNAVASLDKIEETLANHWEQAESDKSAIPIPSDHLETIHALMSYEQPRSEFNFLKYLDGAWQGYLKDKLPATRKKIKEAIAGDDAPEEREPEQAKRCLNDTDCTEDETCYKGQCQPQRTHGRFGTLEFDEALQRYREGQVMKLTRSKLRQLIHEELERKIANKPIPVEEFEWGGKELKLSSAEGRDSWSPIKTKKAFYAWKATVLSHGKGSEVVLDTHLKRWVPAAGPWKEKSDAYSAGKAQDMAIHGSH